MSPTAQRLPLALLLAASTATAAEPALPTVAAPIEAALLEDDAGSLHKLPANLGFLDGAHLSLRWAASNRDLPADGVAAEVAWGLGGFGTGLALDWTTLGDDRGTLATGFGFGGDRLALGLATRTRINGDARDAGDGLTAVDLSLAIRLFPWIGVHGGIAALNAPQRDGLREPRAWTTGVLLRSRREGVAIGWDLRFPTLGDPSDHALTLAIRPADGLRVFGSWSGPLAGDGDQRWTAGVELAIGPATAGWSAVGRNPGLTSVTRLDLHTPWRPQALDEGGTLWRIDLHGPVSELPRGGFLADDQSAFTDLLADLRRVRREAGVAGVYLHLSGWRPGWAQAWELRSAIEGIRAEGMHVVVYAADLDLRGAWVASAADAAFVAPTATLDTPGVGGARYYLGDLLERIGVSAQFVRIGDWKSWPETFERSAPSPEAASQTDAWVSDVWSEVTRDLSLRAAIPEDRLRARLSQAPLTAADLVDLRLFDGVAYEDELRDRLAERFGVRWRVSTAPAVLASDRREWAPTPCVAVVHLDGTLAGGPSGVDLLGGGWTTGAASVEAHADAAVRDPRVHGVVVRIDSPGGLASASDEMHRALLRLARRRPVVISFANVAASGGYWAAAIGAPIHATPVTLTGSIGIYSGTFAVDGLLSALHIGRDLRGAGRWDLFQGRAWTEDEQAAVQRSIESGYRLFLERVATARGVSTEAIDAVGQGRIWSGGAALGNGLVDAVGGFDGALDALESMGVSPHATVRLCHYPETTSGLLDSFSPLTASTGPDMVGAWLDAWGVRAILRTALPLALGGGAPLAHLPLVLP